MSHDTGGAVAKALCAKIAKLAKFAGQIDARLLAQSDWASVTFSGSRHHLRVELNGPGAIGAAADFLGTLPELELPIPDHIVADIALVAEERRDGGDYAVLELEVLTIEDH